MKLKIYNSWIICLFFLLTENCWAQITVTNKGVSITNTSSAIYVNGNYVHDSTSKIANGGTIHFRNNIINSSGNNMFVTDAGKVVIDGISPQEISGDSEIRFYKLDLNKSSNELTLSQSIRVNDTLLLIKGNLNLNGNEIDLGDSGELVNEENNRRIFGTTGKIKARRYIDHPEIEDNIAGLGIFISSKENFSYATIERGHEQQSGNGDTSIFRYYNFIPEASVTGLIDSLKLTYFDSELIPGENLYKIYYSGNDGLLWKNKGGIVDTNNNYVITTTFSPPEVGNFMAAIFPIESFATCLPNDPNYISAIFLVSTSVIDGDSVKFIQLSDPIPQVYTWNFGDGNNSDEYSPYHIYSLQDPTIANEYQVTITVTNGFCSDTRKKKITVNPETLSPKLANLYNGIEFFNLYPNPNDGSFNIEVKTTEESDMYILIMDMQGRLLDSQHARTSSYKNILNYESLSAGVYFVKLQVNEEMRVIKIIKM